LQWGLCESDKFPPQFKITKYTLTKIKITLLAITYSIVPMNLHLSPSFIFFADRTNGCTYAVVLHP